MQSVDALISRQHGSSQPVLRPQDVAVLLRLVLIENATEPEPVPWTLAHVAEGTGLSVSEIHFVLRRVTLARLFKAAERRVNRSALVEFVVHGVKYAFPPRRGTLTRGMPTAHGAPPLKALFMNTGEPPPVWPYAAGTVRGIEFSPLYPAVPKAALSDPAFYELLALVDALRGDARARERKAAEEMLRARVFLMDSSVLSAEEAV